MIMGDAVVTKLLCFTGLLAICDKAHACPLIDGLGGMFISTCSATMHQPNAQTCKMLGKDFLSVSVAEFCKFVTEKEAADVVLKSHHMMFA